METKDRKKKYSGKNAEQKSKAVEKAAPVPDYIVSSRTPSFRRCSRFWNDKGTEVRRAEFTDEEWKRLTEEPRLKVGKIE